MFFSFLEIMFRGDEGGLGISHFLALYLVFLEFCWFMHKVVPFFFK